MRSVTDYADVVRYINYLPEQFKRWKPGVGVSCRLLVQFIQQAEQ